MERVALLEFDKSQRVIRSRGHNGELRCPHVLAIVWPG